MKIHTLNLVTAIRFGGGVAAHQICATDKLLLEFVPAEEIVKFIVDKKTVLIVPRDNVASMVPQS